MYKRQVRDAAFVIAVEKLRGGARLRKAVGGLFVIAGFAGGERGIGAGDAAIPAQMEFVEERAGPFQDAAQLCLVAFVTGEHAVGERLRV